MLITYLIGLMTVICLQKENFGSMKMQAAFIAFFATLLATTWAQPIEPEDLPELESRLTVGLDRWIGRPGDSYVDRCRRCNCRCVACTADVCSG